MATTTLYDQFITLYKSQPQKKGWLGDLRAKAFQAFSDAGFPTVKSEDWRFTNIAPFLKAPYSLEAGAVSLPAKSDIPIPGLDAHEIVLKNGLLNEDINIKGVKITPLRKALADDSLQPYLGKHIDVTKYPFVALNTAFFENGIVIEIDKNTELDKPLHITHVYNADQPGFIQPRILVIANKSSKAEIVESIFVNGKEPVFVNAVYECYVAENAQLDQYYLQVAPANAHLVNFTQAVQLADSIYNNYTLTLPGATLVRNNLHLDLAASNIESHMFGLYLTGKDQLIDNHTFANHLMPHCCSNEIYKGVLLENGRGVFSGKIYVHEDAQKTNAFQQNNNVLLSDKAVIDSKPQLEIFADDVKCSHGSTVGSLNKDALFYLKSRGIGDIAAKNLLVNAFAFDVTQKIKIGAVQDYIENLILEKMTDAHVQ